MRSWGWKGFLALSGISMSRELTSVLIVGGNAISAFLSWRLQATNSCDVTLVWKSGFESVSQYGISFKYVPSFPRPSTKQGHTDQLRPDRNSSGTSDSNPVLVRYPRASITSIQARRVTR